MKKINDFMRDNPKYRKYQKPLEAAEICDAARALADGRFEVISYRDGLLTVRVTSSSQATQLSLESAQIIKVLNQKIGRKAVLKMRYKL